MSLIQPVVRAGESAFGKIARAISRPAVPELEHRGTAAAPALLEEAMQRGFGITEMAPEIPYAGSPELQPHVRATAEPHKPTFVDMIHNAKEVMGAVFRSDPNLAKDIQAIFKRGRWQESASQHASDSAFRYVYEPLSMNPKHQARLMHDYLIVADNVAQGLRQGTETVEGKPIGKWLEDLGKLEEAIGPDTEIAQAIERRRELWDNIFNDMNARGWIGHERYLEDYTPLRKLNAIRDGLAVQNGEKLQVRKLAAEYRRTGAQGERETNLLILEHDLIAKYFRKVANHETFQELIADKTIHFTDQFSVGDKLPKGLAVYRPGTGMTGYSSPSPVEDVIGGMVDEADLPKDLLTPGGYVFPEPVVRALEAFSGKGQKGNVVENALRTSGRTLARWWTVYNPVNTRLNMASDLFLAMHGMPGEKAHPIGILKWYPTALKAAYKGAFEKGKSLVKIGGQTVDLWELVEKEGLAEATLFHQVQGQQISSNLQRLLPESMHQNKFILFDVMQRDRLGTELAPRIAAGLEAWQRTGDISEFGRVGREITLHYGAGAPLASRTPIIRILSPFVQFVGLASGRVFDLLRTEGSRGRALASVMAVPTVTWMWNTQNDEFRAIEDAIPESMRDQAHVIVPDPMDPTKPRYDTEGRPLVLAFRYSVPEEVMKMAGLGNITSRVHRVVRGRQTPGELVGDIGKRVGRSIVETATLTPGFLSEVVTGKTDTGQELKFPDRIARLLPIARIPLEAARETELVGPGEAAVRTTATVMGARPINVMRRGEVLSDADLVTARREHTEAKSKLRRAMLNEGASAVRDAEKRLDAAVAKIERISNAMEKEDKARGK